jgi:hypothetical protein
VRIRSFRLYRAGRRALVRAKPRPWRSPRIGWFIGEDATHPLPKDPALATVALALNAAGYWAEVVDHEWRHAFTTDELPSG